MSCLQFNEQVPLHWGESELALIFVAKTKGPLMARSHCTARGTGPGQGIGQMGLLYIMLYCSHCRGTGSGKGTGKRYNGLQTHFSVPDLCPSDVL